MPEYVEFFIYKISDVYYQIQKLQKNGHVIVVGKEKELFVVNPDE